MTPAEFIDLYNGWLWRENRRTEEIKALHELEMRRLSVLASWVTAPHMKKPKQPTDFYNPEKLNKEKPKTNPEKSKKVIEELEKQMGVK
jgi:hypothetical protein